MGFELQMVVTNRFAASRCSALIAGLPVVIKKCGHTLSRFHSSHVKLMGVQCFQCFRLLQDLIRFALQTGTRIGEIFSLCWNDVDLEQGIISVRAQKTGSVRKVPINNIARRILDFQQ
jgi:integrase